MQNQQNQDQNQKQIANPSSGLTPQIKSPEMNIRDYVNDALSTCKYITDSLNVAIREASHRELYEDLKQMLTETHDSARKLFNLMFELGWYKLEAAEQQKIDQAFQQFKNYSNQFPYPNQ